MALVLDALALALVALGSHAEAARVPAAAEQAWRSTYGTSQFGSPELAAARQACERQIREAAGDEAYDKHFAVGCSTPLVEIETCGSDRARTLIGRVGAVAGSGRADAGAPRVGET